MKATNIQWDADTLEEIENLPEEIDIPDHVAKGIRHINEIKPEFNVFMGYETGVSKKWWHGIKGITYIFMGSWNDSCISYKNLVFSDYVVEDEMWARYNKEFPVQEDEPSECEAYSEKGFSEYMRKNAEDVLSMLDDFIGVLMDNISDYITESTGFCHGGFRVEASV